MPASPTPHIAIAIIGTGFGGLGLAIRLKQSGRDDFLMFERDTDVGGTWRDNSYPGCACDVESLLYSFSFAPNPRWSRTYSPQPEIQAYLQDCARRFDVLKHVRFQHNLTGSIWHDTEKRWHLTTSAGDFTADVLVSAVGPLSAPEIPSLKGIETFTGKMFHSAQWDHKYSLAGKRVAVIGTGASAIQFVPQIQPQVSQLTLFQRTPPWILPRRDRPYSEEEKNLHARFPLAQKFKRLKIFVVREFYGVGFRRPKFMAKAEYVATRHLQRAIASPELRRQLLPKYQFGCKRVLLSDDYYPALAQSNVELVTERVLEVRAKSIVTADNTERPIDVIIYGTGFQVTNAPYANLVKGRDGLSLAEVWQGRPGAYVGTTVAGFPNLFILHGPNTGLGHNSAILMLEAQIKHVLHALTYMRRKKVAAVEPTAAAAKRFSEEIARRGVGTVWTLGCNSWYLDRTGFNSTLWPASVPAFKRRVEKFRSHDYQAYKTIASQAHLPTNTALSQ